MGTNSIGWAVVDCEAHKIEGAGSRILPMDAAMMGDYEKGNSVSQTADRTAQRGVRRLRERFLLRRERLLRVLRIMGYLPEHYVAKLDRYGHLPVDEEPKLAWREGKEGKMEFLFEASFQEMAAEFNAKHAGLKVPKDWTIYFLRKKALSQALTNEELAWVLMQFNQKRGYNQLRGKDDDGADDNDNRTEEKEYHELKVVAVEDSGDKKKDQTWWLVKLENGWTYRRASKERPDWVGKTKPFIVTFKLDKDGKRKNSEPDSFRSPDENDWWLKKMKLERNVDQAAGLTIGEYIYKRLLAKPDTKIIGETVSVVDRKYYRAELHRILEKQAEYHAELRDHDLYISCLEELYHSNDAYRRNLEGRNLEYLIVENILLYQRPLKSKKSLIADCQYEKRYYKDSSGELHAEPLKGIAKSHPLFQEFRIWQWILHLEILNNNDEITKQVLDSEDAYCDLYDWLASQEKVSMSKLLNHYGLKNSKEEVVYRWNYVPDKDYPMGETRSVLLKGLKKAGIDSAFLTAEKELALWHILYSIDDPSDYAKALHRFARKQGWEEEQAAAFVEAFRRLTVCKEKDYGAYSAKAIGKLLPLMRRGRYWSAGNIDQETQARVQRLADGEVDEGLSLKVREHLLKYQFDKLENCRGMRPSDACYLVYGRHSEAAESRQWNSPDDIDDYLTHFRQHSLNNPIVEQVVTESLRTVRDIWKAYGKPDEIHIEIGRELKKTREERERLSKSIAEGEERNQRIRVLLKELAEEGISDVRAHSPMQQELLKIYEMGVSDADMSDELRSIRKNMSSTDAKKQPSHSEVMRYKTWLDQKYVSPYTGQPIPLAKLFTPAYEIEHVIPQSRYFDDSLTNKVICEAEVNKDKGRMLGHEYIVANGGKTVKLNGGGSVKVLTTEEYEILVRNTFKHNKAKMEKLMLDDIPESFNERQMNDSRYISRLMTSLLSNIVRTTDENGETEDTATAKNVVVCTGSVTDTLKHDWGLDDVWNAILLPRFQRMEEMTGSGYLAKSNGHTIPSVPLNQRKGFQKKRLDHRHHAMDAIVIACASRSHVNLLNNESAAEKSKDLRYDLQKNLREEKEYIDSDGKTHKKFAEFRKPWDTFTQDAKAVLDNIVVSYKQKQRVINKTGNHYTVIVDGKKSSVAQHKGDSWAIRQPLHKDTVFGEVNLQLTKMVSLKEAVKNPERIVSHEIKKKVQEKKGKYTDKQIVELFQKNPDVWSDVKQGKVEVWYYTAETNDRYFATRKALADVMKDCTNEAAANKAIDSITDSGIRQILKAHLAAEGYNAELAFSPDGLERMNANLIQLNGGKPHQPIKKVRKFEKGGKFAIGEKGINNKKFVMATEGTNMYFVIYLDKYDERGYATIPLNVVIDMQKRWQKEWQSHVMDYLKSEEVGLLPDSAMRLYCLLSPGDLVYVPEEGEKNITPETIDRNRIYKVVSFSGNRMSARPANVANIILDKVEFESHNKIESTIDKKFSIKKVCIPLKVDRIGEIIAMG